MTLPTFGSVGHSMASNGTTSVTKTNLTELPGYNPRTLKSSNPGLPDARLLGRPTELSDEEWLRRYKSIRWFLQVECGKIGYELPRVQSPQGLVALFGTLQDRGSREQPVERIIKLLTTPLPAHFDRPKAARSLRQAVERASQRVDIAWAEFYKHADTVARCQPAMQSAIFAFGEFAQYWPCFCLLSLLAQQLGVVAALEASNQARAEFKSAQNSRDFIANLLLALESGRAQQELLRFVANTQYSMSREYFAAVMAGLPELGWISSLRRYWKCRPDNTSVQLNCQVFEVFERVVRSVDHGTDPLDSAILEAAFQDAILELNPRCSPAYHLRWNWGVLRITIAQLNRMTIPRDKLPHIITAKFEDNIARPKDWVEAALIESDRMEVWSCGG